jgi:outer membrane protein assembly factor BamB
VENRVYFGSLCGIVYCLNATEGKIIWNFTESPDIWCSPTVTDKFVYIGAGNKMYCSDINGNYQWNFALATSNIESAISTPAFYEGKLIFGSGDGDTRVYCVDASTGQKIWSFEADSHIYLSPAV